MGAGDRKVDIFPGQPDLSILPYRMASTQPGVAMPELGRQKVHDEALGGARAKISRASGGLDADNPQVRSTDAESSDGTLDASEGAPLRPWES